jgi:beta-galactosidase
VASFDGVNDYVNCSNDVSLDITGQITLAAWVKTQDAGNSEHNPYVAKGDSSYAIKHRTANEIEFFIYDANTWYSAAFPVTSSFNGVWHHLAGTYDGSNVKLYVDGELTGNTAHTGSIASNTYNVNIGRDSQNTDRLYEGEIDDIRIYGRALSQGEVAYLAGKTTTFTQPLELMLTPYGSAINLYEDDAIDLRDYAILASMWLEVLLWP